MMMLALMYGFTPMPMIDAVARPPPEKRSSRPSSWFESGRGSSAAPGRRSAPGHSSATRKIEQDPEREQDLAPDVRRAERVDERLDHARTRSRPASAGSSSARLGRSAPARRAIASVGPPSARARASALAAPSLHRSARCLGGIGLDRRRGVLRPADALGGAAGGGELVERRRVNAWAWIVTPFGRVAAAEDLERHRPGLLVAQEPVVVEHVGRDQRARLRLAQRGEVDRRRTRPGSGS